MAEYRPKHIVENIFNKVRRRIIKYTCWLFISVFLDMIYARETEHIKVFSYQTVDVHHARLSCL
jgi:hypothetical protein